MKAAAKKIIIIGGGDLGQLIAYHVKNDAKQTIVGFLDDTFEKDTILDGLPVLGGIKDAKTLFNQCICDTAIIAIGYNHFDFRASVFKEIKQIMPLYSFIHSSAYIDPSTKIGNGVVVLPGCVIDKGCVIEDNVLMNAGVVIAHDSKVKEHSFFGPGVKIAGFSVVGSKCFLGISSTILNNLTICDSVIIAAGALVNKSITEKGTYIGIPAKIKL
jgi:sugar O-acyltransferase (sialic acid O-acetyltransferase NeuD family)